VASVSEDTRFTIVQAGLDHLDVLVPLFDAYRVFYDQPSDLEAARNHLWTRLNRLESVVFLAREGEKGLDFTQLYSSFASVSLGRVWILYDLYVAPEVRRQGIGRALLEHVREFAEATGAVRMELSTAIDNRPGQALYESLGWVRDNKFYTYELTL